MSKNIDIRLPIPAAYRPSQQQVHMKQSADDGYLTREYVRSLQALVLRLEEQVLNLIQRAAEAAVPVNPVYTPTAEAGDNPISEVKSSKKSK